MFYSVRYLCYNPVWGLNHEKFLWISDISRPDPYMIISSTTSLLFLLNFEIPRMFARRLGLTFSRFQLITAPIFRTFILGVVLFTMHFPAAIHLYLFGTAIMNLFTASLWRTTIVQRALNLPPIAGLVFSMEHSDPEIIKRLRQAPALSRGTKIRK
jgi:membrane protein insertase Oxa1/YidC/SpoIIIJ